MIADSVKFKGHLCFKNDWAGFDCFKPINLIIGKNNTGKSRLLDLVEALATKEFPEDVTMRGEGVLDEAALKSVFGEHEIGGELDGELSYWLDHGRYFIGKRISWETGADSGVSFPDPNTPAVGLAGYGRSERVIAARKDMLWRLCSMASTPVWSKQVFRLCAERDIVAESAQTELTLNSYGRGATNVIRRHLTSSSLKSSLIEADLQSALNRVFRGDTVFTSLGVYEHDDGKSRGRYQGTWEVVLSERSKGRVPLSASGSGLKTVILVLLNLLVMPRIHRRDGTDCIFIFEELENNLHPTVFRRLLAFIEEWILREKSMVFLTTHSSVALDVFGPSKDAQIVHLTHDGVSAKTTTVAGFFEKQTVLADLGAKPSDLLQANGVIWVEGPSDRVYINRWIDLASDGTLREGRDYQCAFLGGSMLANDTFVASEQTPADLVNLLRLNANIAVVCDSDRTAAADELKTRVQRVKQEVEQNKAGFIWVTSAKEIENYLPLEALQKVSKEPSHVKDAPAQFEHFFPSESGDSFWERAFKRKTYDKVDLARRIAPHMTKEQMESRFDWAEQMRQLVGKIRQWNA
jgi:predicted ATPase